MANIMLRLPDEVHDLARIAAARERRSLNGWIVRAIQAGVLRQAHFDPTGPVAAAVQQIPSASPRPRKWRRKKS